jgi:hypothetical protein
MKNIACYLVAFFSLMIFVSCQKEIEVNIPFEEEKIVVDGKIEAGLPPYVILTKNMPSFGTIGLSELTNLFIHGAEVRVSNGVKTVLLNEYYSKSFPDSLKDLFASISGIDSSIIKNFNFSVYSTIDISMFGKVGSTYALTVVANGKKLSAVTSILKPVPIDSLWHKYVKVLPNKDSLGYIYGHFSEPGNEANAYRWMAKRVGKDASYVPPRGAAFNDKYINGKSFDFFYNRGRFPNSQANDDYNEYAGYYKKGDTVAIKLCSIDQAVYKFYRSLELVQGNNGNPFASPASVETNIYPADKALGVWCGYGVYHDTLIFK